MITRSMKTRSLALGIGVCVLCTGMAFGQAGTKEPAKKADPAPKAPAAKEPEKKPTETSGDKGGARAMEEYAKASAPNENHKALELLAGNWEAKSKFRMAPEAPWMDSTGTEYSQMWYDGRYLHTTYKGDMGGMEFKGLGVMGYDNGAKEFQGTWIDSMSTGIIMMTGTYDAKTKTFTMNGEMKDPMDGKVKKMRETVKITGADSRVREFFEVGKDGKEFKSMEINYTRKQKDKDDDKPKDKSKDESHSDKEKDKEHSKDKPGEPKKDKK